MQIKEKWRRESERQTSQRRNYKFLNKSLEGQNTRNLNMTSKVGARAIRKTKIVGSIFKRLKVVQQLKSNRKPKLLFLEFSIN